MNNSEDPANPPIKTVSSKVVYENPWIKIHEDQTTPPSGKTGLYGYLESRDSVMTAILDDRNRLIMIRAFRYPSKSWGWQCVGGGTDTGEEAAAAALREVEEETGIRVSSYEKLGQTLVCNGLMTERMNIFVGYDLRLDGKQDIGDEALGEMRFFTMDEVDALVEEGEINDGQTIAALYFLKRWLDKEGR